MGNCCKCCKDYNNYKAANDKAIERIPLVIDEMDRRLAQRTRDGFQNATITSSEISIIAELNYDMNYDWFYNRLIRELSYSNMHLLSRVDGNWMVQYKQERKYCCHAYPILV